jgi:hypothetical protein
VTPNEHKFYFFLEAETFDAISGFLGSPFLEDHDGHISPVLSFGEARATILEE